jgi:hypothetical protein
MKTLSRYERYKEYYQKYRQTHKDFIRKLGLAWWAKNPEYAKQHQTERSQVVREWRQRNPDKYVVHTLIMHHPEDYPLGAECVFCGATSNLEHAHLDYEDYGHNYVTACHLCNMWMEKEGS